MARIEFVTWKNLTKDQIKERDILIQDLIKSGIITRKDAAVIVKYGTVTCGKNSKKRSKK